MKLLRKGRLHLFNAPAEMPELHWFNPGHETAVWMGTKDYTPPASVRRMMRELASLPVWYAGEEDFVFVEEPVETSFFSSPPMQALRPFATLLPRRAIMRGECPDIPLDLALWGLSPHAIRLFERLRETSALRLSVPAWQDVYTRLTGRQTARDCLALLKEKLPHIPFPPLPVFVKELSEIERFTAAHTPPFIVKTPYSSSGRGLLRIAGTLLTGKEREWIGGALKRQGTVSIEPALDKQLDFALEFYSDGKGEVTYEGLSVFRVGKRGDYSGNRLGGPDFWEERFSRLYGHAYTQIKTAVRDALSQLYGRLYTGYMGVDMMVYRQEGTLFIHPCVEINMRYTMGLAALCISRKYIAPGSHGIMCVTFDARAGEACRRHLLMQTLYPPEIVNGRIRKGYLSLCPVTEETGYRAYILLSDRPEENVPFV